MTNDRADNMTIAMARLIRDGEIAFHGVASPMPAVAIAVARALHAPRASYVSIAGSVNATPTYCAESTAGDGLRKGAISSFSLADIFDLSARGRLDVAFLSGAQIDAYGRLNLSAIGSFDEPKVRLPGGAGSAALLPTVKRGILWKTTHDTRSFVEQLDVVTAAGNTEYVITPLAVLQRDEDGRLAIRATFGEVTVADVQQATAFAIEAHPAYAPFSPITDAEREALRQIDPHQTRQSEFG